MSYQVHTFGCKVNTYDTGLIQKNLLQNSICGSEKESHIHVLNTCAVTEEATKEAVRYIRKLKAKDPLSTIVVTGCAAQVDTGSFQNLPGVDLVVANSHKGMLPQILDQYFKGELKDKVLKSNIFHKEDLEEGGGIEEAHTRAFVKIQDGCNQFCSYCIIPFARGKSRSLPMIELARRIQELSLQGIREVVLTGVHIGDYCDETAPAGRQGLESLIEYLLLKTTIQRFRLTSLEPIELTEGLIDLYQDERLCRHFHMSIQSANTEVLQAMKRKYTKAEVIQSLETIENKVPGSFVGMDVIVGFPNESEDHFLDTYQTLAEAPWTRIHVFPYSERPGTKATLLSESVYPHIRKERAKKLRELSLHRFQIEALRQVGKKKRILVLKDGTGISRDYWTIQLPKSEEFRAGSEIELIPSAYETPTPKFPEGRLSAMTGNSEKEIYI